MLDVQRVALGAATLDEWSALLRGRFPEVEWFPLGPDGHLLDGSPLTAEVDAMLLSYDLYWAAMQDPPAREALAKVAARSGWVQTGSAGWDGPVLAEAFAAATRYSNAAGVHAVPIAQWCLGQMLRRAKRMDEHAASQRGRRWEVNPGDGELTGRRLGILGMGGIGIEVARLGQAFGMETWGVRRSDTPTPHLDRQLGTDGLDEVVAGSDYLVLCVPHSDETIGLMDAARLASMKPTSCLLNVGRGTAIVNADLAAALRAGTPSWAALDAHDPEPLNEDSPLWELPNCVVTPHDSAHSRMTGQRLVELFVESMELMRQGKPPRNLVKGG